MIEDKLDGWSRVRPDYIDEYLRKYSSFVSQVPVYHEVEGKLCLIGIIRISSSAVYYAVRPVPYKPEK